MPRLIPSPHRVGIRDRSREESERPDSSIIRGTSRWKRPLGLAVSPGSLGGIRSVSRLFALQSTTRIVRMFIWESGSLFRFGVVVIFRRDHGELSETVSLYADRTVGGDCDHRHPHRAAAARGPEGPRGCSADAVPEQS